LLLSIAGGLLGIGGGILLLSGWGFAIGTEGVAIALEPSFRLVGLGTLVAAAVGLLAGLAPGYQAARTEIVAALRQA
ncbi:MAG: ABC transporter permease, partial [Thermoguttaceae bacterium]